MYGLRQIEDIEQMRQGNLYGMREDMRFDTSFFLSQQHQFYVLDAAVEKLVKLRKRQSHKGSYGHALIMAGSYGKMGAAVLCTQACLRSGVGLLTAYVPRCGYNIMQTTTPEAMCLTDSSETMITNMPDMTAYNAIAIGPGMGHEKHTAEVLQRLFAARSNQTIVIDADGLNSLAENKWLLTTLPNNTILTPHIKEFERLVGPCKDAEERILKLQLFCRDYHCIVVLKDAHSIVCAPSGTLFFNTTGNAGMATGGSGDVLAGIITALLAQQYAPLLTALLAVYFHGKAGDDAAKCKGEYAMTATDIIEHLRVARGE